MGNTRRGAIPSELGWLVDELDALNARLDTLEAPSGETLNNTIPKLQALIEDIQDQLDAWAATRWTNAEITAQINAAIAALLAGNVTIAGNLRANGTVTFPNVPATVFSPEPRAVVWVDTSNGRLGRT